MINHLDKFVLFLRYLFYFLFVFERRWLGSCQCHPRKYNLLNKVTMCRNTLVLYIRNMMLLVIPAESSWLSMSGNLLERSVGMYSISKILYITLQEE